MKDRILEDFMLTNTTFKKGTKCEKAAYLYAENKQHTIDPVADALQEQKAEVKDYARKYLFPSAIKISSEGGFGDVLRNCLIEAGSVVHEPKAFHEGEMAEVDYLIPMEDGGWQIVNVLASTEVKTEDVLCMARAVNIFEATGRKICSTKFAVIDTETKLLGKHLFKVIEYFEKVCVYKEVAKSYSDRIISILKCDDEPDAEIGKQCLKPNKCEFADVCLDSDRLTIYSIPRLSKKREAALRNIGILYIDQLSDLRWEDFELTEAQRKFVRKHLNKVVDIDWGAAQEEISSWKYPRMFLDFETDSVPIPKFDDCKPYEQVPFQYSLTIRYEDGRSEDRNFLYTGKGDPRLALAKQLHEDLENTGSLVAYYVTFEKKVISRLAELYPKLEERFKSCNEKAVDLYDVVKNHVVHHKMKTNSIKEVLPALLPGLSYEGMDVSNGLEAQINWRKLVREDDLDVKKGMIKSALEYCDMDVKAMIELTDYLDCVEPMYLSA